MRYSVDVAGENIKSWIGDQPGFGVVGVVAVDGTLGVVILGVEGNDGTEVEGLEVVNDGLDIVLTFGRIGIAL